MKDKDIFNGFMQVKIGKGDEPYHEAEALVLKHLKPNKELDQSTREQITKIGIKIYKKIASCMKQGEISSSKETQSLIKDHYVFVKPFHDLTKEVYEALAKLYTLHPAFRKQLDAVDPLLADYIAEAMCHYAEENL